MRKTTLTSKNKINTMILIILIILVLVALWVVDYMYFRVQEEAVLTNGDVVIETDEQIEEFKQIEEQLLNNDKFNALTKIGEWPVDTSVLAKDKEKPFGEGLPVQVEETEAVTLETSE